MQIRDALDTDMPAVRGLKSIDSFDVFKATGMLMGEGKPPYQYIEIIRLKDMDAFGKDLSKDQIKAVVDYFRSLGK